MVPDEMPDRRIKPLSATAKATPASLKRMERIVRVVPLVWRLHAAPPFVVLSIVPEFPTTTTVW